MDHCANATTWIDVAMGCVWAFGVVGVVGIFIWGDTVMGNSTQAGDMQPTEASAGRVDGGPAFPARPTEHMAGGIMVTAHHGMTLRDYFAGQPGIEGSLVTIGKEVCEKLCGPAPELDDTMELFRWQAKVLATLRYISADAMIAARGAT